MVIHRPRRNRPADRRERFDRQRGCDRNAVSRARLRSPEPLWQYVPIYATIAAANTIIGFGVRAMDVERGMESVDAEVDPDGAVGVEPVGYGNVSGPVVCRRN